MNDAHADLIWTGALGRQLCDHPPEVRELASYLICGPSTVLWGVWKLELQTIAYQTGRTHETILQSLTTLEQLFFARYDQSSEYVFVPEMPALRLSWPLMPQDNNIRHAKRWYAALPKNPFSGLWYDLHVNDLFLTREPVCQRRDPPVTSALQPSLFDMNRPERQPLSVTEVSQWFERIVEIYPKGTKLDRARSALAKLRPTADLMREIWRALEWQTKSREWLKEGGQYAPSLYDYFVDHRWTDVPSIPYLNTETVNAMSAAADFINDADEEEPCDRPLRNVRALVPPSKRLRS